MTKKELKRYRRLEEDIAASERHIKRLEQEADSVPVVKVKVQSSQKDWPYIETHETVEAPEPKRYTKLQREIVRNKKLKEEKERQLIKIGNLISGIEEARSRAMMYEYVFENATQKKLALKYDLTESAVSKIISKICREFN